MSWISTFLEQTKEMEAPSQYYFWGGMAALSAAVKDHVWINRGSESRRTYPNIYVLLLAKTGTTRKSSPVSDIERIVTEARCTRVIAGRSSIEKIIDDLGTAVTIKENGQPQRIIKDSCGFIVSGELSASLVHNTQAMTVLTNLYDRNYNVGKWTVNLKSGVKVLDKPTISFLGATNDQHMKSFFEAKDMYGGFLGRTLVVSADSPKTLNPLLRPTEFNINIKELALYLNNISKLNGSFKLSEEVIKIYEDWYLKYYGDAAKGEVEVNDKTGTFSRIGEHSLKVAMLLSLSEGCGLEISEENMIDAISLCEPFVELSRRAVRGIGKSPLAEQTAMVMNFLERRNGYATKVQILQAFQGDIDHEDLAKIAINLDESKFITIELGRGVTAYQMPKEVLDKYRAWKEAKLKRKDSKS